MSVCCVPKIQYMNENLFLKAVGIRYANVSGLGDVFIMWVPEVIFRCSKSHCWCKMN